MRIEMGNQNTNGLQVSKQESDQEDSKVINQSPNASFVTNDLDGLKEGEKPEDEKPDNNGYLESTMDTNQTVSTTKNEALEKQDSVISPNTEAWDSLTSANEEQTFSVQDKFSKADASPTQKQTSNKGEEDNNKTSKTIREPPKLLAASSNVDGLQELKRSLPYDPKKRREVGKLDSDENLEYRDASNDTEVQDQFVASSTEEEEHDRQTQSAHGSLETDNMLIQKQIPGEKEEEAKFWAQESMKGGSKMENHKLERRHECIVAQDIHEKNTEKMPVEDMDSSGEMLLMNSSEIVEASIDQNSDKQHEEDVVGQVSEPWQRENHMSNGSVDAYLDAIDIEIHKLLMEDDVNELDKSFKTELNGYNDDIDADSFEIQLKSIDYREEEKEEEVDAGLEEAVFEIALQPEYNPCLVSGEPIKEDLVTETKVMEMGTTIVTAISVTGSKNEEILEYEGGEFRSNEIRGEIISRLASCSSDPMVEMVKETEDSKVEVMGFVSKDSERGTIQLENSEILEKETESLNVMVDTAEMASVQKDGKFEKECITEELETPRSKEGLISVSVSEGHSIFVGILSPTANIFLSNFDTEAGKQQKDSLTPSEKKTNTQNKEVECVHTDQAVVYVSATNPEMSEDGGSFNTELNKENDNEKADDNASESVKCLIYTYERSDLEAKGSSASYITADEYGADESEHLPSTFHDIAIETAAFAFEGSEAEEDIKEYHVNTNQEVTVGQHNSVAARDSTYDDKSPLLMRKSEESEVSATELNDSEKFKTPLRNLLKEDGTVVEPVLKNTIEELQPSPAKKYMAISAGRKGKQKPKSSLFGSCICCTPTTN